MNGGAGYSGGGVTVAQKIVEGIIRDLTDRRGFRHEWEGIDEDIQQEIRERWEEIIIDALSDEYRPD